MDFFNKREVPVILAEYDNVGHRANLPATPAYADYILQILLGKSLAEDFQLAEEDFIEDENQKISSISNSFASQWLVFALSGQGDYWLLHRTQNTIGFYDHNQENFALSNAQELGITLEEWVVLGDLFHQFDLLNEFNASAFNNDYTLKPEYKTDFIEKVNAIKKGLFETMPFNAL